MIVAQMHGDKTKKLTALVLEQKLPWKKQTMTIEENVGELSKCKNWKILTDVTTQSWP